MTKKTFAIEQSPFYKERQEKPTKDIKGRVPIEAYNELESYFNVHYGDKSKGIKEILMNFLNNLCQEQSYFKNLNAILLMPKTLDPGELNDKCELIGFVDAEDTFKDLALFHGGARYNFKYRFIYTLEEFNKTNYFLLGLHKLDKSYLFDIDKQTQDDFDKVKSSLSELYEDIDIDDAYFVMFNLNNYLDIEDKGQYVSKSSELEHDGVIILLKNFDEIVCALISWSYLSGDLSLSIDIKHISEFNSKYINQLSKREIAREYGSISTTLTRLESLERKREHSIEQIEYHKQRIETLDELIEIEKNK